MENATKAIIIAGSILIAIALIAVAVRVLNESQEPAEQVGGTMESTEISMFNSKFLAYVGSNKSSAEIKSLLNLIMANNATAKSMIEVNFDGTAHNSKATVQDVLLKVINDKKYSVTYAIDDGNDLRSMEPTMTGCIYKIIIISEQ